MVMSSSLGGALLAKNVMIWQGVLRKGIDRKREKVSVRDNSNESKTVINQARSQLLGSSLMKKV